MFLSGIRAHVKSWVCLFNFHSLVLRLDIGLVTFLSVANDSCQQLLGLPLLLSHVLQLLGKCNSSNVLLRKQSLCFLKPFLKFLEVKDGQL